MQILCHFLKPDRLNKQPTAPKTLPYTSNQSYLLVVQGGRIYAVSFSRPYRVINRWLIGDSRQRHGNESHLYHDLTNTKIYTNLSPFLTFLHSNHSNAPIMQSNIRFIRDRHYCNLRWIFFLPYHTEDSKWITRQEAVWQSVSDSLLLKLGSRYYPQNSLISGTCRECIG